MISAMSHELSGSIKLFDNAKKNIQNRAELGLSTGTFFVAMWYLVRLVGWICEYVWNVSRFQCS